MSRGRLAKLGVRPKPQPSRRRRARSVASASAPDPAPIAPVGSGPPTWQPHPWGVDGAATLSSPASGPTPDRPASCGVTTWPASPASIVDGDPPSDPDGWERVSVTAWVSPPARSAVSVAPLDVRVTVTPESPGDAVLKAPESVTCIDPEPCAGSSPRSSPATRPTACRSRPRCPRASLDQVSRRRLRTRPDPSQRTPSRRSAGR